MQTATVSDLAESLSPAEEATAQREDSSGAEESEPAPKRQREKQQDISMLMAFDEDQETEDHKKEMKTYLEDRTKSERRDINRQIHRKDASCQPPRCVTRTPLDGKRGL
ncbi:PHD and RING finger domain containing protein 1 [Dissostichus eleginoides]|uniref:PHD and RING finger domain containing protein 1 n=1 Tax=Dissostichus eleginoides TaxID=100907 RepID=A0AAD9FPD2_DISEL|nr:PHD and RING finger domain containing protein 1 [Dissostichus eleginoides]